MQGFLEVFAFWGEPGIFLLKIIICIKSGNLLGNIFFFFLGGGGVAIFFMGGGGRLLPKTGLQEALVMGQSHGMHSGGDSPFSKYL